MKKISMRHLMVVMFAMMAALPVSAQKETDNIAKVKNIIDRYDLRNEDDVYVSLEEGLAVLCNRLKDMPSQNVSMTLRELERRHLDNEYVLNFAKTIKGKEKSKKYIKNLTEKLGEERASKALIVLDRARAEETMYPKVITTLEKLKADIEKTLAERTFPEGKLLSLYYLHGGGMRGGRYEFQITINKQGQYEMKTIRPGTPIYMTYSDDAMATYDVDEAFVKRIVEALEKSGAHKKAENNRFFPGRLLDAPTYRLQAKFEKGVIKTSGDGTLPVASEWEKIVEEESK